MGWVADRIGIRATTSLGAVMTAAGLALSATGSVWALYVGHGLFMGFLGNGALYAPAADLHQPLVRSPARHRAGADLVRAIHRRHRLAVGVRARHRTVRLAGSDARLRRRDAGADPAGDAVRARPGTRAADAADAGGARDESQPGARACRRTRRRRCCAWPASCAASRWRCRRRTWWRSAAISASRRRRARRCCRSCSAARSCRGSSGAGSATGSADCARYWQVPRARPWRSAASW